ncbi:hypothetical protein RJT34_09932 [Clitoria ternatea]|uniref:Uncharacterized protein n=1 Tax=Clitoria ternatea TaxID=43366 RepID=A0AAN9PVQ1_CLITE
MAGAGSASHSHHRAVNECFFVCSAILGNPKLLSKQPLWIVPVCKVVTYVKSGMVVGLGSGHALINFAFDDADAIEEGTFVLLS